MPYYKIDDVVYVNNVKLSTFGEVGVIRNTHTSIGGKVTHVVYFSSLGKTINLSETNLSPYSDSLHKDSRKDTCEDSSGKLAYVYYHDEDQNPSTLKEALEYCLFEPSYVLFGTKKEILEEIKNNQQYNSHKLGFIIMDGKIYNINTTISVDW